MASKPPPATLAQIKALKTRAACVAMRRKITTALDTWVRLPDAERTHLYELLQATGRQQASL